MQKLKSAASKSSESSGTAEANERDWSKTLYLPKTEFPMKAGLPKLEPQLLERWEKMKLFEKMRKAAKGRERFTLHDGPPYANGNIHIGHALNKILKDIVSRSQSVLGKDSNYVPGWDCHGLPIEWKIEEQYRAKGKNKDEVPIIEFRRECREFADHWIDVQRDEFKRLAVEGDWKNPYTTMTFDAEAVIANELMKFAMNGSLFRGSKPVMWSVVEKTALAEAEVEYRDYESDTVWVKFPIEKGPKDLKGAFVVIWTTTPWTMPGNRCVCYSESVAYGLYEVESAENDFGPQPGERYLFADKLAEDCAKKAKIVLKRLRDVTASDLTGMILHHPFRQLDLGGYQFLVPMLQGDHVTDDAGTGFVHTAPGHGRDDFENWIAKKNKVAALGIDTGIPFTVDDEGYFTQDAPGFEGGRVLNDKGEKGDANKRVIEALIKAEMLFARGRLKHDYPHSWRSKKPIIFRNTPQWFIAMDKPVKTKGKGGKKPIREMALAAIDETRFVPKTGQKRLRGMIDGRPDWVISRQRAWGVPITVFLNEKTGEVIPNAEFNSSKELIERITKAFKEEGADAWFEEGAKQRFLEGIVSDPEDWKKVDDILDVWFESGSTHAFVLEKRKDLGGSPASLYLEGSDQHRGWFHSSLLESCGTRGRAPYDAVLTHGFILNEKGEKMSKSENNAASPEAVIKQFGAEILRLWVASSDYSADMRFGPNILKTAVDAYRKIRNSLRFMLGNLAHYDDDLRVDYKDLPELERFILHRLWELDEVVRQSYDDFDFKRVFSALSNFCTGDLSSLYFDIRKDALYCEAPSSMKRRAALTVLDELFSRLTVWLSPILSFTMEEAYLARFPNTNDSVHLHIMRDIPGEWRDDALAKKWRALRDIRHVVTGALEIERREKRIGSSLEAAPVIHITDKALYETAKGEDWAEIAITSDATLKSTKPPAGAFTLDDVAGVAVVPGLAKGKKCARSWRITTDVGSDKDFPDLSARDAAAVRELDALSNAA